MGSVQGARSLNRLFAVLMDLFKPVQTFFLVLSGVISYVVSSKGSIDWRIFILLVSSLYLTVAGTTGLNMYLDKDIDSVMERTKNRALPSGKLDGKEAIIASSLTLSLGLLLSFFINLRVLIAGSIGAIIDLVIYTYLLKKRTPLSVVFGSIAGGMPGLGGWLANPGSTLTGGLLIASLIALWSLNHIWFIASYYSEDYLRARVPMLPVVANEKIVEASSWGVSFLLFLISVAMWFTGLLEFWTLVPLDIYIAYLLYLQFNFFKNKKDRGYAKKIFRGYTAFLGIALFTILIGAIF